MPLHELQPKEGGEVKSPAFQFYPSEWLSSQRVSLMTLEEEGAYIRLLCYCWQHGSIPVDTEKCAKLIGKGGSTTVARVVQAMFQHDPLDDSRLIHDRLEVELAKQDEWRRKSSEGGKKGAESRKQSRVVQGSLENGTNQKATLQSPSPSPSPISLERVQTESHLPECIGRPTLTEVKAVAGMIGLASWKAEDWFSEMQGCGWRDHANRPIHDWRAVMSRVRAKWEADGRPKGPPGRKQTAESESPSYRQSGNY